MDADSRKGAKSSRLLSITLFFLTSIQVGFSQEYRARLGSQSNVIFQRVRRQSRPARVELMVTDFHVRCSVVSRYACTTVQSSVWNQLSAAKEAVFEVDLPSSAFISNFSITSNGKVYVAQVKERGLAKKIYDAAKKKGKTAGLVATKEREMEKFRVGVSVPPGARLTFSLSYEELLSRRLGRYELALGLRPGMPVQNLTLDATVAERTGISFIKTLPLRTSRLLSNTVRGDAEAPPTTVIQQTPNCAHVRYTPTLQQQTSSSPKGLNADFIIQYDVELSDLIGDVQIYDGYFVHYFAPRGLPVVPKDVIFVIDISGSMIGTKIKQTKQAMATILTDLREGDHFNLITFSDKVHIWKKGGTVRATPRNVLEAKDFVKKINAAGWTNINAALLSAAHLVSPAAASPTPAPGSRRVPLVIFLTDGEATIGVTSGEAILRNARSALGSTSLFGLAFGDDADFPLLRRLTMENRGVTRMVYEDADAELQLKGFYDEVASPLLSDVQLSYLDDQAYDVTRALFPNYFQGSELVVAGRVKPGLRDLKVSLTATDSSQKLKLENDMPASKPEGNVTASSLGCPGGRVQGISSFVRRLWAYFTIKELLQAKLNSSDPATQRLLGEKAINLSLKYNFVTPVTSLVVVKPDVDETAPNSTTGSSSTTTPTPTTTTPTTTASTTSTTLSKVAHPHTPIHNLKMASPTKKPSSNSSTKTSKPKPDAVTKLPPPGLHTTSRPLHSPHPGKPFVSPNPAKTALPVQSNKTTSPVKTTPPPYSGKASLPPSEPENGTAAATHPHHPHVTTLLDGQLSVPPPTVPPLGTDSATDGGFATLVAATFVPMPGVTDAPRQWEVSGLLDVSTVIQFLSKDMDLDDDYDENFDSDYVLGYDSRRASIQLPLRVFASGAVADQYGSASIQLPQRVFASVDGDPHFVVQLPKKDQSLCFTIDGRANDVLRLLEDPEKGIVVDGHLMWAPSNHDLKDRARTYFDLLTISAPLGGAGSLVVTVTMDEVVLEGEGRERISTNEPGSVARQGLKVTVDHHRRCWVELGQGLRFLILFHHYKHPTYLQMAHLGFYIADGRSLSPLTQGLLGQFQHADAEIMGAKNPQGTGVRLHTEGVLRRGATRIPVTLQDKNMTDGWEKQHLAKCWVVARVDVERLLGHPYQSYVVDRL